MSKKADADRRARNSRRRRSSAALRPVVDRDEIAATLPDRMLTHREVLVLVSVSDKTLTKLINEGRFPAPTMLSAQIRRWWYSEVVDAIAILRRRSGKLSPEILRAL